jgi:2-keto-3-deoxy-L-rhamnonate aldolase RhmA
MRTNPLLEKLRDGETSLGLYVNSPDMVELCGFLGFDWFMIDQMWTSNDWQKTEELVRAGEASGITPVVRVQSYPWLGHDRRVSVDVARALGIGAQFVLVSHSGKEEIEECLEAARSWHTRIMTIHPYRDFSEWDTVLEQQKGQTYVIPQPETRPALDSLEEVIANPEVRLVFIAMTDASRVLTGSHTPDFYHPALWDYVDRAVALGKEHGVVVGANTSYAYSLDEIAKRARLLHEHGVRVIMLQGAPFLFQIAMTEFLRQLQPSLARP